MRSARLQVRNGAVLVGLSLAAYLAIGLPDGMLGIAWPSMAEGFGVDIPSLGLLLAVLTVGYGSGAALSGRLMSQFGPGAVVTISAGASALGVLGYTVAPNWAVMLGCAVVTGYGVGTMDGGLNAFAALRFSSAVTNWIHGFYALGASVGPAVMTGILLAGGDWQIGYLVAGSMLAAVTVGFLFTRTRWRVDDDEVADGPKRPAMRSMETLRLPAAWLGIGLFMVYTGLEVAAGQWTFTVLTEDRGVSTGAAGAWVTAYYVGLTGGRIGIGSLTAIFPAYRVLRISIAVSALATLVFWLDLATWTGFVSMFVMGLSFGPVFPSLISSTPMRVGRPHTPNTVGFQVTGAAIGAAALPGGFGIVAGVVGLGAIPLAIFAGAAALLVLFIVMERVTAHKS